MKHLYMLCIYTSLCYSALACRLLYPQDASVALRSGDKGALSLRRRNSGSTYGSDATDSSLKTGSIGDRSMGSREERK